MRRGLATLLLAVGMLAAGLLLASPAQACSCVEATIAEHFTAADVVFTGTLLSRDVDHPDWPTMSSTDPALHVFAVDAVYKGEAHQEQGVVSAADGASCGLELAGTGRSSSSPRAIPPCPTASTARGCATARRRRTRRSSPSSTTWPRPHPPRPRRWTAGPASSRPGTAHCPPCCSAPGPSSPCSPAW